MDRDADVIAETEHSLMNNPSEFKAVQLRVSQPLEKLLPMKTLKTLTSIPAVRTEIERRNNSYDRDVKDMRKITGGPKDKDFHSNFVEKATALYHLHGLGKKECSIGNALVHDVLIPRSNQNGIKDLKWTRNEVEMYHKKYQEACNGQDCEFSEEDFELSHPLDKEALKGIRSLEISGQPNLETVSDSFCGRDLETFKVSCCGLKQLPVDGFGKCMKLAHIDVSGNMDLDESSLNSALSNVKNSLQTLDISSLNITAIPPSVSEMKNLVSLKVDNCPLKAIRSSDLPESLKNLSCKNYKGPLPSSLVFSHLEKLNISGSQLLTPDELVKWIHKGTAGPKSPSPMKELKYSRVPSLSFTEKQQDIIIKSLPNLEKGGLKNVKINKRQ